MNNIVIELFKKTGDVKITNFASSETAKQCTKSTKADKVLFFEKVEDANRWAEEISTETSDDNTMRYQWYNYIST